MDTKREHRTHAEGSPRGNPYDLTYSPSGRLIGKFRDNNSVMLSATVYMAYGYCNDYQPHAVKRMFDYNDGMLYDMRWDEAGNLGQVSIAKPGEMFETGRFLFWTEDNRMHAAVDDRYYSYYAYDHSGERRLKLTGDNKLLDVNADFMATYTILNEPTLYPSAYMVLTNKGYTKHYYAGTERVAARLGGGGLDALYHAIGNNNTIQTKANLLFDQSLEQVNNRILYENNLDCIMHNDFAKEEFGHWIDGIPYQMQAGVELNHDQFKDMVNSMLDDINHGQEKEVYFYHSDHLGSASWITDFSGVAVQHIQYLPYGEPYINQHPFGYSERFTFTGKERDEETGYGYFGARYMDHELLTSFLSVDRYADKYPSISPYAYCAWNPIKLNDPDGEDPVFFGLLQYQGIAKFGNSHLGETQQIGNFLVTPFYDNNNNLLGYNAGRYRSDGSFVNEYQMGPGDIKMFSQNVKTYEDAANLVYCAGEPDWSYVAFGSYLTTGNYHAALSELGKMWGNALSSPSFYIASTLSVLSMSKTSSVKQILRDIRNIESSGDM